MKKYNHIFKPLLWTMALAITSISCSDDDTDTMDTWQIEVAQVTTATAKYSNIEMATVDGFIDVSGFVPNMGHHYLLPPRVDNTFVLEEPEILLYAPDENGVMQFVGIEYVVPIADLDNPGSPPEGFTGAEDEWEINANLSQWQLHVWTIKENPDGIFASHNPTIGTGN